MAAPASCGLSGSRVRTNQASKAPTDPAITTKRQPSRPNTVRGTNSQPRNATTGMAANWMILAKAKARPRNAGGDSSAI